MAIGEIFLGSLMEMLFDSLASPALMNFAQRQNIRDLLKKWERNLLSIQSVLDDAEDKAVEGDRRVQPWLEDLRDLAYDMEDLLDELTTEEGIRSLSEPPETSSSKRRKVSSLLSSIQTSLSPQAFMFDQSVRKKIEEIEKRLIDVVEQKNALGLRESGGGSSPRANKRLRPPSTSLVDRHVFGRESDRQKILDMLEFESDDPYSVIPIVGMPGVGKTTLAQLVFNDAVVINSFAARGWACVSDYFDATEITRTVLQSVSKGVSVLGMGLDMAQRELSSALSGKKFLVVLDDVWTEKFIQWDELLKPFQWGARGSKIIVTTRHQGVAMMAKTVQVEPHSLKGLSSGACLSLFAQSALGVRNFDSHPHLKPMGEKIVEKCAGLPLVAKTLGGLLRANPNDWKAILESEVWDLPKDKTGIHSALKLSYIHLPSHVKRCFAYCALFPKGYEFDKHDLVRLWMAEGLLGHQNKRRNMWDRGFDCFVELISRSFFQQSSSENSLFVMHDLMNDLAKEVAGETCLSLGDHSLDSGEGYTSLEKARHLSFISCDYELPTRFEGYHKLKGLRTLLALNAVWSSLADKVVDDLLQQLKYLRALSLGGYEITEIPDCIGYLKHLRYLNLTGNQMESLPESICALYNLQTLILKSCRKLFELPNGMGKLINLQYLDIRGTSLWEKIPLILADMVGLKILSNRISCADGGQRLTELKHLLHFHEDGGQRLKELKHLQHYREGGRSMKGWKDVLHHQEDCLTIFRLNQVGEVAFLKDVKLNPLHGVNSLSLEWDEDEDLDGVLNVSNRMQVLEFLQPHIGIKGLKIRAYEGIMFPTWIESSSVVSIVRLHLLNCRKVVRLPPLGELPLLKELIIEGMDAVSNVGLEFYGNIGKPFPSLEILKFHQMSVWQDWVLPSCKGACDPFSNLHELYLHQCPKLKGKLPGHSSSLVKLQIDGCPMLLILSHTANLPSIRELVARSCNEALLKGLSNLSYYSLTKVCIAKVPHLSFLDRRILSSLVAVEDLELEECHDMTCLWEDEVQFTGGFPRLSRLAIGRCRNIENLMPELQSLTSLVELRVERCSKLKSFTSFSGDKIPTGLKILVIADCEKLQFLPQGIIVLQNAAACSSSTSASKHALPQQLEYLRIIRCPSLMLFQEGNLPTTLRQLLIHESGRLHSLANVMEDDGNSPSLEKVSVTSHNSIKSLTTLLNGLAQLTDLRLYNCATLGSLVLPHSLKTLILEGCKRIKSLPHQMDTLTSLTFFYMHGCTGILSFPECGLPPNLKLLEVGDCPNLNQPMSEWGLLRLTALQSFVIGGEIGCLQLQAATIFPPDPENWCSVPSTLTALTVQSFKNLVTLSEGLRNRLTSLQILRIKKCPKLQFLPKEGFPASLIVLKIQKCSVALNQRCQKGGDYFPLVERIPYTEIAGGAFSRSNPY